MDNQQTRRMFLSTAGVTVAAVVSHRSAQSADPMPAASATLGIRQNVADMDDKVEKVAAWLPYLDMGSALDRQVAHNIRTILELPEGS